MTTAGIRAHLDPTVRHDMVFFFDVTDGNPNGDPDAGNQPRTDLYTGHGLVTDVAIKRKFRDGLALAAAGHPRYGIFVEAGHALNTRLVESLSATGVERDKDTKKSGKAKAKLTLEQAQAARAWLCDRYADIRLFGAVLSTGETNALGAIRGPLQFGMARSIDPITPTEHAITRVTQTRQEDIDNGESTEMGSKWTVPYALYRVEISYSAARGIQTGVDTKDFELLYQVMEMMFDHDASAARGRMTARGLHVFSHDNAFGNAPAHKLLERVQAAPAHQRDDEDRSPRRFSDYTVSVDADDLPAGITYHQVFA
ncbi:CRISPR-associated protein Csd2 [Nocardia amikacinitolerans]|uniref:type I-C CRISPR-associated protein Cas7/Csd2 n=1 Tax=Nocardia amikacinitolerans TaxID=756689 RepID=UPI0008309AC7|nr:type I-C CRISPR-associated protein Cas7/Csd2 [Nocardia amikacinitolerans]MCP2321231.1 CRISPR-associated protein Csd2 [Nocardia amikacinitolerans]